MALYMIEKEADIPAHLVDEYVEKDGAWVLKVEGEIPDVKKTLEALRKERGDHGSLRKQHNSITAILKTALKDADVTPETIQALVDEREDLAARLEQAGKTAPSYEQIEQGVQRRLAQHVRPIERDRDKFKTERDAFEQENITFKADARRRRLSTKVADATQGERGVGLEDGALDDATLLAERIFEEVSEGVFQTKDNCGYSPGLDPREWLLEVQTTGRRKHWFKKNVGAGANSSGGSGGDAGIVNPLTKENWNMTEIGKIISTDRAKAIRLARAAKLTDVQMKGVGLA